MGSFISRFRKKKNTIDQLEEIEQKIKSIEKFQKETEQQFRRVVGKFVLVSVIIYVVVLCGYYYYFSPETFRENIIKFMPLLIFPVVIFIFRKILSWYFKRKLTKNESTLKILKSNKKDILDSVMEKEVYKIAKKILEKYAPEQLDKDSSKNLRNNNTSLKVILPDTPIYGDTIPRHRITSNKPVYQKLNTPLPDVTSESVPTTPLQPLPRLPLLRPILSKDRGPLDKLVDMLIGDGPNNRYALICRVCSSHNGMALKHEFEYLAFRCAYCLQWNPARKQKPQAPNLSLEIGSQDDSDVINPEIETTSENIIEFVESKSADEIDAQGEGKIRDKSANESVELVKLEESEGEINADAESVVVASENTNVSAQNTLQKFKNEDDDNQFVLIDDSITDAVNRTDNSYPNIDDTNQR
ncbi:hypothetical protein PGB90_003623 [Kerria lacca]